MVFRMVKEKDLHMVFKSKIQMQNGIPDFSQYKL